MTGTQVGAYRLIEQIGAGGMGAVWLAEHAILGRRAAVKILHKDYSSRSEIVSRFFNEARAATAISDAGIVQIFDFGHHTDGTAYIVMELLEGQGLDKRLRANGPMQLHDALRVIRQVSTSLAAAHARGIVHRDLKPENIFLVRDAEVVGGERAKILDFGIAKLQGDRVGWRTETSQVMGTPLYMSPEQCRGAGMVDHRTDIYSLGCMLFVLVTGRPPFLAEGSGDLIAMHLREQPPLASTFSPRVPPEVDQLINRCLAKDPAQRFASGTELANAISMLLANLSTAASGVRVSPPATQPIVAKNATTLSSSTGMLAAPAQTGAPTRAGGRRGLKLAAGSGVVTIGAVIAVVAIGTHKEKPIAASSEPPVATVTDAATSASVPPVPTPTEPAPDMRADMIKRVTPIVVGFVKWSATHKGAPCPTANDLEPSVGGAAKLVDSWGHPISVTCTDQPSKQIIGIVSAGADGVFGNRDDVASWTLGDEVTDLLAGPRWVAKPVARPKPTTTPKGTTPKPASLDTDGDGIPDER
ncbi:MAG TPA: protein kinase [Kofleriaceae bacterium]